MSLSVCCCCSDFQSSCSRGPKLNEEQDPLSRRDLGPRIIMLLLATPPHKRRKLWEAAGPVRHNRRFSSNMTNQYDWARDTAPSRQSDLTALRFIAFWLPCYRTSRLPPFCAPRPVSGPGPWPFHHPSPLAPCRIPWLGRWPSKCRRLCHSLFFPQTPGSQLCRPPRRGVATCS